MTNTVKKIDEIITKIDENHSKKLSQDEAQDLLVNIEKALTEIKKGAEEKHKEVVGEKVKELKVKIDENLEEEEGWGIIKRFLDKEIKDQLKELKDKITESEIPVPIIVTENEEVINFYKNENKELKEKVEKLEKERDEYRNKLEVKEKEVIKLTLTSEKKVNLGEEINRGRENLITSAQLGSKLGSKVMPIFGTGAGTLIGLGAGAAGEAAHATFYAVEQGKEVYEETLNIGAKLAEKTGDNVTDVTKNISDNVTDVTKGITKEIGETLRNAGDNATKLAEVAAKYADTTKHLLGDLADTSIHATVDTVENFRGGAEKLVMKSMESTTSIINEGIGVAREVVKTKAEVKLGALKIELGDRKGEVMGATVEGKDEIIKALKEELEEFKLVIKKRDERISELEKLQVSQQAHQQEDQKFLFTKAFDAMIEVAGKSRDNSRVPSPTPPPYPGEKQ